jgi:hypothetical protein
MSFDKSLTQHELEQIIVDTLIEIHKVANQIQAGKEPYIDRECLDDYRNAMSLYKSSELLSSVEEKRSRIHEQLEADNNVIVEYARQKGIEIVDEQE